MARILFLCPANADFQTARSVQQLHARLGPKHPSTVLTLGPGGYFGNVASAAWGLRTFRGQFDLVHAFGIPAVSAAALSPLGPIVFSPTHFPGSNHCRWLRAVAHYRQVHLIAPTATIQRTLMERGLAPDRVHLIRPGVDFSLVQRRRHVVLRRALGIADDHSVILGCGESTRQADHRLAAWTTAILNVLDGKTRLLLWGRGAMARAVERFARSLGQPDLLILAEQKLGRRVEFEELLGASDVIMITASGPVSTLPIATAMAAGLPIVSTVTPTVAELIEDRHTALMVSPPSPRLLAQKVIQVRADSRLQWSISDMARTEAFEFFPQTRFVQHHREAYEQIAAGQGVEITDTGPGRRSGARA